MPDGQDAFLFACPENLCCRRRGIDISVVPYYQIRRDGEFRRLPHPDDLVVTEAAVDPLAVSPLELPERDVEQDLQVVGLVPAVPLLHLGNSEIVAITTRWPSMASIRHSFA